MRLLIISALAFACFTGCSKGKGEEETPKTNVTKLILMGNAGKRWPLTEISMTYYASNNSVDSVVTLRPDASNWLYNSIHFADNGGLTYMTEGYLTQVLSEFGSWTFNEATQKISFTCTPTPFSGCNGTNGEWQITFYRFVNGASESLSLERTITLTGGRKVLKQIRLII